MSKNDTQRLLNVTSTELNSISFFYTAKKYAEMSGGDKKKADKKDKKPAQQKKETPKKKEEKKDDKPAEPAADAPVRVCLVSHNDPTASSCLPYPLFS